MLAISFKLLKGGGGSAPIGDLTIPSKTFVERARSEVEKVHLEGEVEKAKVRTVAEVQIKEIETIEKKGKEDPAQARKDLAAFLAANL